jgi:TPR repeat protein
MAENRVASLLYGEAARMGSQKATLAIVREYLSIKHAPYRSIGQNTLWVLAEEGSEGAGVEIATRFRDGNAFPRDPALALYWYLRAAEQGSDVKADITALTKELPSDAVRKIEESVAESHVPEFR